MRHQSNAVQAEPIPFKPKALFVEPSVHRRLKTYIAQNGGSMQRAAEEAVNTWLHQREATPGHNGRG